MTHQFVVRSCPIRRWSCHTTYVTLSSGSASEFPSCPNIWQTWSREFPHIPSSSRDSSSSPSAWPSVSTSPEHYVNMKSCQMSQLIDWYMSTSCHHHVKCRSRVAEQLIECSIEDDYNNRRQTDRLMVTLRSVSDGRSRQAGLVRQLY